MLSNKIALPAGWLILSGRFRGNKGFHKNRVQNNNDKNCKQSWMIWTIILEILATLPQEFQGERKIIKCINKQRKWNKFFL